MRVVSQNGAIDVPYELAPFHSCNGRIRMNMAGDTGRGTEMAVYGSQKKALVVMQMLYKAYMECNAIYNAYLKEIGNIVSAACIENCIFQFPADDEVKI